MLSHITPSDLRFIIDSRHNNSVWPVLKGTSYRKGSMDRDHTKVCYWRTQILYFTHCPRCGGWLHVANPTGALV